MTETILRRLALLCRRHNVSKEDLATSTGRSDQYYYRRFRGETPLSLDDMVQILEHIGEPMSAVLSPVLLDVDAALLGALQAGQPATYIRPRDRIQAYARLAAEGLVHDDGTLTPAGIALHNTTTTRTTP